MKLNNFGLSFYSASGWSYHSISDENKLFKSKIEINLGHKASLFSVMGYEMALSLLPVLPQLQNKNIEQVVQYLKSSYVVGPRGKKNFLIDNKEHKPDNEIEKISVQNSAYSKWVIENGKAMDYNHEVFMDIHNNCISGWKNPYLCV